jgi:hypothetical protein
MKAAGYVRYTSKKEERSYKALDDQMNKKDSVLTEGILR